MATIFWVEDQAHWVEKFEAVLTGSDFDGRANRLEVFRFPEAALQRIARAGERPDVAILDARMKGRDEAGFSVAAALARKWPGLPIIYLSEHSGTGVERDALERFGAADFIAKHQRNVEEVLCWRIRAALRLHASGCEPGNAAGMIASGPLRIDPTTWEVYWHGVKLANPANPKRPLSPMPRKILRCLVERAPRAVSAPQAAEYLDVDPDKFSYAAYRQHIRTLRRAFDAAAGGDGEFTALCRGGTGIVAFGEEGAYCWKEPRGDR